jgi:OOP family OmpA-OmpF porin
VSEKVTFATDSFFAFDSAALSSESQAKLTDLVDKTKGVNLEVIIAVGHADVTGPASVNQLLSTQRAEAVKKFLVSKGIEANRVYTEGKGSTQPAADNKTSEGRAKNRRVEVEVVGTRTRRP